MASSINLPPPELTRLVTIVAHVSFFQNHKRISSWPSN